MEVEAKKIVLRSQAKAEGLVRYFTGLPCKNGHISERATSNGTCLVCQCNKQRVAMSDPIKKNKHLESKRRSLERNQEQVRQYRREYRARKPEEIAARFSRWYATVRDDAEYRERKAAATREWADKNPDLARACSTARQHRKRIASCGSSELDFFAFHEAAILAQAREDRFGFPWHVDHMIPLRAKNACGLHCAANLQVIPAALNLHKRNRMIFTEPMEWLEVASGS